MHGMSLKELDEVMRNNMKETVDAYLPEFISRFSFPQKVYSFKYAIKRLQEELAKAESEADERLARTGQVCLRR